MASRVLVTRGSIYIYDNQRVHTTNCFKSFYPEYFADNQIGNIIENDIFRCFDIPSFTRLSLHYTFSKFTIIALFTDFIYN